MPEILYALAVLACPIGMAIMMLVMMRGRSDSGSDSAGPRIDAVEVTRLRAEVRQLREERAGVGDQPGKTTGQ